MKTMKRHRFINRCDAGRQLAVRLRKFAGLRNLIILALPRGGVVVAAEIAKALERPLDVMLVHRLVMPNRDHISFGAITGGGVRVLNHAMIDRRHLDARDVSKIIFNESLELARRERFYRGDRNSLEIADHQVVLVDDGFTPSDLIQDALRLLRRQHPDRVMLAMPVGDSHVIRDLEMEADEVITLGEIEPSNSLGACFEDVTPATDNEILALLGHAVIPVSAERAEIYQTDIFLSRAREVTAYGMSV
jgi:putative phosphoribosyl transferase